MASSTGLKVTVVSSTLYLTLLSPTIKLIIPVLLFNEPAYNFTIPFGALAAPLSDTMISPPVPILMLVFFPAFNTMAPVYPVVVFSDEFEEIGSFSAIFPSSVSTKIVPVA